MESNLPAPFHCRLMEHRALPAVQGWFHSLAFLGQIDMWAEGCLVSSFTFLVRQRGQAAALRSRELSAGKTKAKKNDASLASFEDIVCP